MRTIAATSGAKVTGLTINDYQVSRAKYHNEKVRQLAGRLPLMHVSMLRRLVADPRTVLIYAAAARFMAMHCCCCSMLSGECAACLCT
jgi:hypothetical protein